MDKLNTQTVIHYFICICLTFCLSGCEEHTLELEGESRISIPKVLVDLGMKGYAIDSVYTEFEFYQGINVRISSFRKGIATYANGRVASVTWNATHPRVEYGGSTIIYTYDGVRSELMLNAYGFVESVTNRYGDGSLQSKIEYRYNAGGYLIQARIERLGQLPVDVFYQYSDVDGSLTIVEGADVYKVSFLTQTEGIAAANIGYVCNILRYANAPLTNTCVIIPDLYYSGIYGTPIKYLPDDKWIERGAVIDDKSTIVRVGNSRFFYK
ncbi:MAG: hypothetical protein LBT83_11925 [Tannerella sp.]|jgi:hypothetical protein|nr:hypothetical protein [Tannerella sp.]